MPSSWDEMRTKAEGDASLFIKRNDDLCQLFQQWGVLEKRLCALDVLYGFQLDCDFKHPKIDTKSTFHKLDADRSLLRDLIEKVFYANNGAGNGLPLIGMLQQEIREWAGRYVEQPTVQVRSVTQLLIIAVIDSELIPLTRDAVGFFTFHASGTARFVFSALPWLFLLGSIAAGWIIVAAIISTLLGLRLFKRWRLSRHASRLLLVREEVATGVFDADALLERLKEYERKGLWVPTILYGLLKSWAHPVDRSDKPHIPYSGEIVAASESTFSDLLGCAQVGKVRAVAALGFAYAGGLLGFIDPLKAIAALRHSAQSGCGLAQALLGVEYARGGVVDQDVRLAYYWLSEAEGSGDFYIRVSASWDYGEELPELLQRCIEHLSPQPSTRGPSVK